MDASVAGFFAILSAAQRSLSTDDKVCTGWPPRKETVMLVLSRKLGEKIYIGDNICITVVGIDRGKIRLGIEAPRDVRVLRQELLRVLVSEPAQEPTGAAKK